MFEIFGNRTVTPPVQWRSEPNGRGTWSILSDCLITLSLCLWTALHINIPPRDKRWRSIPAPQGTTRRILHPFRMAAAFLWHEQPKLCWLVLGLFAPEVIAYTAFMQRMAAIKLTRNVQRLLKEHTTAAKPVVKKHWWSFSNRQHRVKDMELPHVTTASRRKHEWTIVHSFYAISGGFVFDTSDAPQGFLPDGRLDMTLTPHGVIDLAEYDPYMLPDISKGHITDKSKANGFAKFLACLQAFWFCTQCVTRVSQGLAISLLELNVFVHALCALLIFALWWDKPLDVENPTLMTGQREWEMCAWMCMRSGEEVGSSEVPDCCPFGQDSFVYGDKSSWSVEPASARANKVSVRLAWSRPTAITNPPEAGPRPLPAETELVPGQSLFGFNLNVPKWYSGQLSDHELADLKSCPLRVMLSGSQVQRWQLASQALSRLSTVTEDVEWNFTFLQSLSDNSYYVPRGRFRGLKWGLENADLYWFTAASFIYGGLHLLAWNAPFASTKEAVLWKTSGTLICSFGFVVAVTDPLLNRIENLALPRWIYESCNSLLIVAIVGWGVGYLVARAYLVVECFIQLARLPALAYDTPNWSQYVPHIG